MPIVFLLTVKNDSGSKKLEFSPEELIRALDVRRGWRKISITLIDPAKGFQA
jgi:hypothetical protein